MSQTQEIQKYQEEVTRELANPEIVKTLIATTFKGLDEANVKLAIVEGMIRGFKFKDFLDRNVYAIPFKNHNTGQQTYSLITSIDYARKIGARSGVIGKSEPIFEEKEGRIITCGVTIKRRVGNDIGEFSSKVYFEEYSTKRDLWTSKPRTMIAKVAEMHALRMACPEEMSQVYVEEEIAKDAAGPVSKLAPIDLDVLSKKLRDCKTLADLKTAYGNLPAEAKTKLAALKDELKTTLK